MIRGSLLAMAVFHLVFGIPVYADRGSDAFKHGVQAEHRGDYDGAYSYYKQAYAAEPKQPKYFAAFTRMRFNAGTQHIHAGQLLRNTGSMPEALKEFQRAVEIDASNFIAQQEIRRTTEMISSKERKKSEPQAKPSSEKLVDSSGEGVELKPLSTAPISLHMTVNSDQAYKTLGKLAGINVAMDPDYRPQKITLDLTDVTLREALDTLRLLSKSYWRPILPNTIFVTMDSPAKRKDLEQNVMRTFYLQNVTAPADLTEAANLLKQMLDMQRIQLVQGQDALIVRGTPDQMILAEKLLADIDKPKPEVVIDVTVMEVNRSLIRTLGTTVPTSTSVAYLPGGAAVAAAGAAASNGSVNVGSFSIAVPGTSFSFLASDSNAKVLQNPEIRALNNEKSTLKIGDRIPIATGSFQPGLVGGGSVSPLVSTQFQYIDVGVNIDITPHIHSDREVTLKMSLEISSVTGSTSIGGITQPNIGQRRIDHEMRLVDGEVNLLGGILQSQETQSLSGYPWISKIPILKYLFAQDNKERTENEIVFAITPHIVRGLDITEDNQRMIEVGTGNAIELHQKQAAAPAAAADAAKAKQPTTPAPSSTAAAGSARASAPAPSGPQSTPARTQ